MGSVAWAEAPSGGSGQGVPQAEATPRIGVVGLHQRVDRPADALDIEPLMRAIEQSGRGRPVGPQAMRAAIEGREDLILVEGLLGPGRELLAEGRNLYNQARPEEAVARLEQAVASLRRGMAGADATRDLWEAWVYLGTALLAMDRHEAGRFALGAAAALNPGRSPNPALFPPAVVQAWEAARAEGRASAVTLEIEAPDEAEVTLDGVKVTGRTVQGVLPGEHFLVAVGPFGRAYRRLRVAAEVSPTRVTLEPADPILGEPADTPAHRARQTAALYRALGTHAAGVDLLLLAGVEDEGLQVQLYAPRTEAFSRPVERDAGGAEALAWSVAGLMGMVERDGSLLVTVPGPIPLDLGANETLARMLTVPDPPPVANPAPDRAGPARPRLRPLPVILGVVGAAAVGTGTGLAVHHLVRPSQPAHDGTIIVGPF